MLDEFVELTGYHRKHANRVPCVFVRTPVAQNSVGADICKRKNRHKAG